MYIYICFQEWMFYYFLKVFNIHLRRVTAWSLGDSSHCLPHSWVYHQASSPRNCKRARGATEILEPPTKNAMILNILHHLISKKRHQDPRPEEWFLQHNIATKWPHFIIPMISVGFHPYMKNRMGLLSSSFGHVGQNPANQNFDGRYPTHLERF